MDSDGKFAIATLIIICVTVVVLFVVPVSCGNDTTRAIGADEKAAPDVSPTIEHANGCPLDAVAYDAPKFASGWNDAYKVTDRFSKQEWWIVRMDGKWVVLPIESKEAVDVG